MSHQFPAFRLVTLLARQMSSPIATRIKKYAKTHPRFSETVCARTAQLYRYAQFQARCAALKAAGFRDSGYAKRPPPPLSPNEAREMGGDILGEVVIFIMMSSILIFELNRQAEKAEAKEAVERETWIAFRYILEHTKQELESQQKQIDFLRAILNEVLEEEENKKNGNKPNRRSSQEHDSGKPESVKTKQPHTIAPVIEDTGPIKIHTQEPINKDNNEIHTETKDAIKDTTSNTENKETDPDTTTTRKADPNNRCHPRRPSPRRHP